jgi:hypothetical protein
MKEENHLSSSPNYCECFRCCCNPRYCQIPQHFRKNPAHRCYFLQPIPSQPRSLHQIASGPAQQIQSSSDSLKCGCCSALRAAGYQNLAWSTSPEYPSLHASACWLHFERSHQLDSRPLEGSLDLAKQLSESTTKMAGASLQLAASTMTRLAGVVAILRDPIHFVESPTNFEYRHMRNQICSKTFRSSRGVVYRMVLAHIGMAVLTALVRGVVGLHPG